MTSTTPAAVEPRSLVRKARPGTAGADGYTPEFGAAFCARIEAGEAMWSLCGKGGWPPRSTVYDWIDRHARFAAMYARAQMAAMRRGARAMVYIADVGAVVCERLGAGEPLASICADPTMPSASTVNAWRAKHMDFETAFRIARETKADLMADEVVAIADAACAKTLGVARLRIEARKWATSKLSPRRYGWSPAEMREIPYDDLSWLAARYEDPPEVPAAP